MGRFLVSMFSLLFLGIAIAGAGILYVFYEFGRGLPDYRALADYEPPVMTRIYAGDGRLVGEYAIEKRVFVPLNAMPVRVVEAFLSAEDKGFFQHSGVDFMGVARALVKNLRHYGSDRRPAGASTITQQVAKNFLLSNEVSYKRKIKEAILAFRIERSFTKEHILELYLNEIYLGFGSYGVTAAAMNYFNRSLDELTIAEAAFLAALPKAPNNYNPIRSPEAARERRDWVIGRMLEDGDISQAEAEAAISEPLLVRDRSATEFVKGGEHFVEDVRRELLQRYGETALYKGGLQVRTTLDPEMQHLATAALRNGLIEYDRRHGWRGPVTRILPGVGWIQRLVEVPPPPGLPEGWEMAVVLGTDAKQADIGLVGGRVGRIPLSELTWARPWREDQELGPAVHAPSDVLQVGDVVVVQRLVQDTKGGKLPEALFGLRQMPKVDGALVALDPHTGRVLAMAGGFSYERSEFNRASQALRQPGSAFKPFVYLAALDSGFTPSSIVVDAPLVIDQGPGLPKWKPTNYTNEFYGPSTLRLGIEKSRNLMTVRLAQSVGMRKVADYSNKFGITDHLSPMLAMSLGSGETTVLRLTGAYAMLVNGGKRIKPTLIDRIQDRSGRTIYRHDDRACQNCRLTFWTEQPTPDIPDVREQLTDPMSAYQMVSILEGVVLRGTGQKIAAVGKPLAGKTGTSNDSNDTWFVGFSPDLAVGVFVGFDEPHTLGKHETGGSVAAPIFRDFMTAALADRPATPFRAPPGIRLVRVNHKTGRLAEPGDTDVITEAFKPGTLPDVDRNDNSRDEIPTAGARIESGEGHKVALPEAGGLY